MLRNRYHGRKCAYCPRLMSKVDYRLHPTRDHIMPKSRGGRATVVCCFTCNGIKGDMLPDVWAAYMDANPGWWKLSPHELRVQRRRAASLERRTLRVPRPRAIRFVVVPPELIYGHSKEGHSDALAAVVGSPAKVEA